MPVDKSSRRVRTMFGQIANRYDFLNHFLSAGTDIYWRWRTARSLQPISDAPILDVCTGTGDLAIALRKQLGNSRKIVGSDFTHEMLVIAQRKLAQTPGESIPLIEADAQELPFPSDHFAAVTVAFGLRNVTNTERGLREMMRVCQPGGEVLVLEFGQPEVPVLGTMYRWYFRNVLPRIGQWISRNRQSAYEYLPESVGEFPSGKDFLAMMKSCGFESVQYKRFTFGVAMLYRGRKPDRRAPPRGAASEQAVEVLS